MIHSYLKHIVTTFHLPPNLLKAQGPATKNHLEKLTLRPTRLINSHVFSPHLTPDQVLEQTVPLNSYLIEIPVKLPQQLDQHWPKTMAHHHTTTI